jgi:dihydrofolate reductase
VSADADSRLILHLSVSIDGFAAHTDGELDWLEPKGKDATDNGGQRHRLNLELLSQIDLIVMGSGAYTEFKRGWSGSDSPMARYMNGLPKLVFSQSLQEVDWTNSSITRRPLREEIVKSKAEAKRDIVCFGGVRIAHSLIRERLVDEYRLTVHPVMLGDGMPLMHGLPEPQRLKLVSTTTYVDGSVSQVLRPAPSRESHE